MPGEQYQPQHPRFGVVYLNLAEYVDVGPVTRRHLLRESKTNATLQVSFPYRTPRVIIDGLP